MENPSHSVVYRSAYVAAYAAAYFVFATQANQLDTPNDNRNAYISTTLGEVYDSYTSGGQMPVLSEYDSPHQSWITIHDSTGKKLPAIIILQCNDGDLLTFGDDSYDAEVRIP